jgi:hypothetical protein
MFAQSARNKMHRGFTDESFFNIPSRRQSILSAIRDNSEEIFTMSGPGLKISEGGKPRSLQNFGFSQRSEAMERLRFPRYSNAVD